MSTSVPASLLFLRILPSIDSHVPADKRERLTRTGSQHGRVALRLDVATQKQLVTTRELVAKLGMHIIVRHGEQLVFILNARVVYFENRLLLLNSLFILPRKHFIFLIITR